jgi:hypothetical protein
VEISSTIKQFLTEFDNRRQQLNDTTIAEIQKQKETQEKLFNELKENLSSTLSGFNKSLQEKVKNVANKILFNDIKSIPTEETTASITYLGSTLVFFDKEKTDDFCVEQVNTYTLCTQIEEAVDSYAKSWNEEWQKLFKEARKELSEKLIQTISNSEKSLMNTSFDDRYYRDLIDRNLDALRDKKALDIGKTISKFKREGDTIANKQFNLTEPTEEFKGNYSGWTYGMSKDKVSSFLANRLREHNNNLLKEFQNMAKVLEEDVDQEVQKNLTEAVKVVEDMKSTFAEKLKKEGEAYLAGLEKDLAEKTAVLNKLEAIINCLTEMSALYKA